MKGGLIFKYTSPNRSKNVRALTNEYILLSHYLSSEGYKATIIENLQAIQDVEDGKLEDYFTDYGNACGALISRDGVTIDYFFDHESAVVYPLHVFKKALEEWLDFLETGREREVYFD